MNANAEERSRSRWKVDLQQAPEVWRASPSPRCSRSGSCRPICSLRSGRSLQAWRRCRRRSGRDGALRDAGSRAVQASSVFMGRRRPRDDGGHVDADADEDGRHAASSGSLRLSARQEAREVLRGSQKRLAYGWSASGWGKSWRRWRDGAGQEHAAVARRRDRLLGVHDDLRSPDGFHGLRAHAYPSASDPDLRLISGFPD